MDNKKYKALKEAMEKYGEALVKELVQQIKDADKVATGNLARNIDYDLIEDLNSIAVNIKAPNYLAVVDGGREKGAKAPPKEAIVKWIKVKGIQGRDKRGRFIKREALAFMISRSISRKGIKPTFVIKKSLRALQSLQKKLLTEAAVEDMSNMIKRVVLSNKL